MPVLLKISDLRKLGWTPTLIRKLLGEPDEKEPYKRGPFPVTRYWYLEDRVNAAMETEAFRKHLSRCESKASLPALRGARFERKYQGWRTALPDACHGLHSANRLCKHRSCSPANKLEIYALKNQFIELLYRSGYCVGCWVHVQVLPAKRCFDCGGTGDNGACDRCDGTGEFLPTKELRSYCFRFDIGGRIYTWHQPSDLVTFPVTTTAPQSEWTGAEREKPLEMAKSKLGEAKALIGWVLERAKVPEAVTPEIVFRESPIPETRGDQMELWR